MSATCIYVRVLLKHHATGEPLTESEMQSHMAVVVSAGFETTSHAVRLHCHRPEAAQLYGHAMRSHHESNRPRSEQPCDLAARLGPDGDCHPPGGASQAPCRAEEIPPATRCRGAEERRHALRPAFTQVPAGGASASYTSCHAFDEPEFKNNNPYGWQVLRESLRIHPTASFGTIRWVRHIGRVQ